MSKFRREFKNVVYNYTDAEVKVRDATSNDPWGPSGAVMAEIAEFTFHVQAYGLVMGMLWKRLNDHGKNWRHVYKALVVLDYIVKGGSERVVQQCKDNIFSIETLQDFQYIDKDGKDNGNLVREKAKNLVSLLKDDTRLREERDRASISRERNTATTGFGSDSSASARRSSPRNTSTPDRTNHPQSVSDASSTGGTFRPHIDQSRPSARDEEELQLQLALRMSKEQADEEEKLRKQEEESLKIALEMSKQDTTGEEEETPDDSNTTGGGGEGDLLGSLADPWAGTGGSGTDLPPSYDLVTGGPTDPFASKDPFAPPPPVTTKDPFAPSPPVSGPWGSEPISLPTSSPPPIGFINSDVAPSTSTWTSFSPTSTTVTDPFAPLPTIGGGVPSTEGMGGVSTSSDLSFDLTSFNAPLTATIPTATSTANNKQPTVEESFLGNNATLVNLDSLIAPLPPPSSINPFGLPPPAAVTPPTARSNNPFETSKPPAPTLSQLKQGPNFDSLPPPLLPTSGTGATDQFNPFS